MLKYLIPILLFTSLIYSQEMREGESLDKIVAVVGKYKIQKSEIDAQMARYVQQSPGLDFNDAETRGQILESLIDEKLILTKAEEDSIEVTDPEVEQRWDQLLQTWIAQYGSRARVETILGKPLPAIKEEYSKQIKNQIMTQKMTFTKFGQVSISPVEVDNFYREYKDSLKYMPDQYDISHIVLEVKADNSAKQDAYDKAMDIRDSIITGTSFSELALRHSDDDATSAFGGELGWFPRGRLFPEFENAAFLLQKGETSLPIETPFGYHIIQTVDKEEERLNTRHILIKFAQKVDARKETYDKLMDIRKEILTGEVSFQEMAKKHSDDESTKGFGGDLGKLVFGKLTPPVQNLIDTMDVGDITLPLLFNSDPAKPSYHIVLKKDYIPSHKMTIEEDKESVKALAKAKKQQRLMQEWIAGLREDIYYEIKD